MNKMGLSVEDMRALSSKKGLQSAEDPKKLRPSEKRAPKKALPSHPSTK